MRNWPAIARFARSSAKRPQAAKDRGIGAGTLEDNSAAVEQDLYTSEQCRAVRDIERLLKQRDGSAPAASPALHVSDGSSPRACQGGG